MRHGGEEVMQIDVQTSVKEAEDLDSGISEAAALNTVSSKYGGDGLQ